MENTNAKDLLSDIDSPVAEPTPAPARVTQGMTYATEDIDVLTLSKKYTNPNFHYRWMRDDVNKKVIFDAKGYEVDKDYAKAESGVSRETKRGDLILMRMPKERHEAIKRAKVERTKLMEKRISDKYKTQGRSSDSNRDMRPTVEESNT